MPLNTSTWIEWDESGDEVEGVGGNLNQGGGEKKRERIAKFPVTNPGTPGLLLDLGYLMVYI